MVRTRFLEITTLDPPGSSSGFAGTGGRVRLCAYANHGTGVLRRNGVMRLWRLVDDANGAILCDACDEAWRPYMSTESLEDWTANRARAFGHCDECGVADHTYGVTAERCNTCAYAAYGGASGHTRVFRLVE